MKSSKKQSSNFKSELNESSFPKDNQHIHNLIFEACKEVAQLKIFTNSQIPHTIISELVSFCCIGFDKPAGITRPVQTFKQIKSVIMQKGLNTAQKTFIIKQLIHYLDNTLYQAINGTEFPFTKINALLQEERRFINPNQLQSIETFGDWNKTKDHLEKIPDVKSKIEYLTIAKIEWEQYGNRGWDVPNFKTTTFGDMCKLEMDKLKALAPLETTPPQSKTGLTLSNTISKVDYIRIIKALCESRCFQNTDGTYPTKKI